MNVMRRDNWLLAISIAWLALLAIAIPYVLTR
jgi:hypothetical protein